jgi:hypothetical protein
MRIKHGQSTSSASDNTNARKRQIEKISSRVAWQDVSINNETFFISNFKIGNIHIEFLD